MPFEVAGRIDWSIIKPELSFSAVLDAGCTFSLYESSLLGLGGRFNNWRTLSLLPLFPKEQLTRSSCWHDTKKKKNTTKPHVWSSFLRPFIPKATTAQLPSPPLCFVFMQDMSYSDADRCAGHCTRLQTPQSKANPAGHQPPSTRGTETELETVREL